MALISAKVAVPPNRVRAMKEERSKPAARPEGPEPPQKVTLAWLFQHMPIRGWLTLIGVVVAAGGFGMKLGDTAFVRELRGVPPPADAKHGASNGPNEASKPVGVSHADGPPEAVLGNQPGGSDPPGGVRSPTSLETIPTVTTQNVDAILERLRRRHAARELTALESGKPLGSVPEGVYCFVGSAFLTFPNPLLDKNWPLENAVTRYRGGSKSCFEFHRMVNAETRILGFVSNSDLAASANDSPAGLRRVVLFAMPNAEANNLMSIPVKRIAESKSRDIDLAEGEIARALDITIK